MTFGEAKSLVSELTRHVNKLINGALRRSSVQYKQAVVVSINSSIIVRLLGSPSDGSEDFDVIDKSGDTLAVGDTVWLFYMGEYTNAFIALKN